MNKKSIFLIISSVVFLFSCKKDYPLDEQYVLQPFTQHFFANGYVVENAVSLEFEFIGDSIGSASTIGKKNGKKYAISVIGKNTSELRNVSELPHSNYFFEVSNEFISLKIISERPDSEANRKFTKSELLELFEVGEKYKFGNAPMDVEIGFSLRTENAQPPNEYIGLSSFVDNSDSTFEVLEIEDFIEQEVTNPVSGLKVTVGINADLGFNGSDTHSLSDVEAVFLFEYE